MNFADPVLELLAYELALIFAVIAGSLVFKRLKQQRRINQQTAQTVKKIKQKQAERLNHLKTLLAEQYGMDGEALEQQATEFADKERQIYKSLLKVFVEQDSKAFASFPEQLEQAMDSALKLMPISVPVIEPESEPQVDIAPDNDESDLSAIGSILRGG